MGERGSGFHLPPPFLFAAAMAVGLWLHGRWPLPLLPAGWVGARVLGGWALIAAAGGGGAWAIATFRRHGTTIVPGRPARALVEAGPYRRTRNPMYLCLFVLYGGLSLRVGSLWPVLLAPLVWLALQHWIVPGEERHLASRFGRDYEHYCDRVRRWL